MAEEYKGIACPNPDCLKVEDYKGGQNTKSKDCVTRKKECKTCGTVFKTVEVPVGVVKIMNKQKQ